MSDEEYSYGHTLANAACVGLLPLAPATLALAAVAAFGGTIDNVALLFVAGLVVFTFVSYLVTQAFVAFPRDPRRGRRNLNIALGSWLLASLVIAVPATLGAWSLGLGDFACDGQLCAVGLLFVFGGGPIAGLAAVAMAWGMVGIAYRLLAREPRPPRRASAILTAA